MTTEAFRIHGFMLLIEQGNLAAAEQVLAVWPNMISCRFVNGLTPVHYAAELNRIDMLRLFARSGASMDEHDNDDQTPLWTAFNAGSLDAAHALLELGADPNKVAGGTGITPLHLAICSMQARDLTQALLAREAQLNVFNGYGVTPLQLAVRLNKSECVVALLEHGADPELCRQGNRSALGEAQEMADTGNNPRMLEIIHAWLGAHRARRAIGALGIDNHSSDNPIKPLSSWSTR